MVCVTTIGNDSEVLNKKRIIEVLHQEFSTQSTIGLHEIAQHVGIADDLFLNLFHSLQDRIILNYEIKPVTGSNSTLQFCIQKKTSCAHTCGSCEHFDKNKCSFWAIRSHSGAFVEEDAFYFPREKSSKAEYSACRAFSPLHVVETHAQETLGSDFVPNTFKYQKLRRINSSLNPHYSNKELDHIQALLSEYFPEELLQTAASVLKRIFEPTESSELLFARFLAAVDLELRASRGTAIRDSVYADIITSFDITEDLIATQRRIILQNLPNHPLRREPVKYLFIVLWNEIHDIVTIMQPPEANAILKKAAEMVETLKTNRYNVINKRLFAIAILYEVTLQLNCIEFHNHLKQLPINAKELYNASFRLRKLLNQ